LPEAVGRYAALWRTAGVPRVMLPAMLARLPVAIEPLGVFLYLLEKTGSYPAASAALAAFSATVAVAWPIHGRLVDRHGARLVLSGLALLHMLALAAFVLAARGPAWLTLAAVVPIAATLAPIGSTVRAAWALLVRPGPLLDTANALEAVLIEVFFVAGPVLAGVLTGSFGALAAVLVAGAALVAGSFGYASAPAVARMRPQALPSPTTGTVLPRRHRRWRRTSRPWRIPGVLAVLVAVGAASAAFAVLEVAVPATVSGRLGSAATGVTLLSLPPAASVIGGLLYGARRHTWPPLRRYLTLLLVATVCMVPLVVPSPIGVLAVCLFVAGLPLAAISAEEFGILGELVPKSAINEAFAVAATMMAAGSAVGTLVAGVVVSAAGPGWARLLSPLAALAALGAVICARDPLRRAGAPAAHGLEPATV
jgi:predicted MFS family arabinose efflux permease